MTSFIYILGRRQGVSRVRKTHFLKLPRPAELWNLFKKLDLVVKTSIAKRSLKKSNCVCQLFRFWEKPQGVSRVRKKIIFALELENDQFFVLKWRVLGQKHTLCN